MQRDFESLSQYPGSRVDLETWEITDITHIQWDVKTRVGKYIEPSYNQSAIDAVREVTSPLWEDVLCTITWWERVKRGNNKWFDILLPDGVTMEAKIWRIGNSAVIKKEQLMHLSNDWYYGIVYYRTNWNLPPSYFTAKEWLKISPAEYLRRNISIQAAFLLPKSYIVYYYNESDLAEGRISTTGVKHKPIAFSRAMELFQSNVWWGKQSTTTQKFWRHDIEVYSIDLPLN